MVVNRFTVKVGFLCGMRNKIGEGYSCFCILSHFFHVFDQLYLFPLRKSNSIVFPQALLASADLFSNLVTFVNKQAATDDKRSNNSLRDGTFRLVEHLRVHLNRISSAERLVDNLLQRLSTGLEDLNCMMRRYSSSYLTAAESGRMIFDRLVFSMNRLSSQWSRFKEVQDRLFKERSAVMAAKSQLNLTPLNLD